MQKQNAGPASKSGKFPADSFTSHPDEVGVKAGLAHQLLMCASLYNMTAVQYQNLIGIPDRL